MSTKDVADFVANLKFDRLPPEVIAQAKRGIQDVIGVMIASHKDRAVEAARRLALARAGKKESTLIGVGEKAPCEMAALVNGVLATTLDLDDGSMGLPGHTRFHRGHPGGRGGLYSEGSGKRGGTARHPGCSKRRLGP